MKIRHFYFGLTNMKTGHSCLAITNILKTLDIPFKHVTLVTDKLQGECYGIQRFINRYIKLKDKTKNR